MPPSNQLALERLRALGPPALRAFFRIAEVWRLDDQEQMQVLGVSNVDRLGAWRGGDLVGFGAGALERISLLLGIFKSINTLFADPARADAWMAKSIMKPPFDGRSAIDFIVPGDLERLRTLRAYLDAEVGDV